MRALIDMWTELNTFWKFGIAILFLLSSTILWFGFDRFWPYGWAVGTILLLFSFPNDAQRRGYHDF